MFLKVWHVPDGCKGMFFQLSSYENCALNGKNRFLMLNGNSFDWAFISGLLGGRLNLCWYRVCYYFGDIAAHLENFRAYLTAETAGYTIIFYYCSHYKSPFQNTDKANGLKWNICFFQKKSI